MNSLSTRTSNVASSATNPRIQNILNRANELNIITTTMPKHHMVRFTKEEHFQHLVLKCSPLNYVLLSNGLDLGKITVQESGNLFLYLDKVTDPHNFGAILRNAFYFVS